MAIDFVLEDVEFNFCHLIKPTFKYQSTDKKEYTVMLVIPGDREDVIAELKAVIEQEFRDNDPKSKKFKTPLKKFNGESWTPEGSEDDYYIVVHTDAKEDIAPPEVVDSQLNSITSSTDCYSGCRGNVSFTLQFYGKVSKGVGAYIDCAQVTYKGRNKGVSKLAPSDVFSKVEGGFVAEQSPAKKAGFKKVLAVSDEPADEAEFFVQEAGDIPF